MLKKERRITVVLGCVAALLLLVCIGLGYTVLQMANGYTAVEPFGLGVANIPLYDDTDPVITREFSGNQPSVTVEDGTLFDYQWLLGIASQQTENGKFGADVLSALYFIASADHYDRTEGNSEPFTVQMASQFCDTGLFPCKMVRTGLDTYRIKFSSDVAIVLHTDKFSARIKNAYLHIVLDKELDEANINMEVLRFQ